MRQLFFDGVFQQKQTNSPQFRFTVQLGKLLFGQDGFEIAHEKTFRAEKVGFGLQKQTQTFQERIGTFQRNIEGFEQVGNACFHIVGNGTITLRIEFGKERRKCSTKSVIFLRKRILCNFLQRFVQLADGFFCR